MFELSNEANAPEAAFEVAAAAADVAADTAEEAADLLEDENKFSQTDDGSQQIELLTRTQQRPGFQKHWQPSYREQS